MDKTETVSIIAICKDGGTKLVEYKGRKYHVDYRINSETSGRVYDDYPNRGNIISDHELEKEIQLALRDLFMKTETKETQGEMHLRHKLELGKEIDHLRSELQKAKELNGELVNRSAQQLKEYKEVIRELLRDRARKLIDQTDTK